MTRIPCPPVAAVLALLVLAACSTPPKPPTVDDANKRPVNDPAAIALQSCVSELTASKIVLTEALARQPVVPARLVSASLAAAVPAPTTVFKPEPNRLFIVHFELGASDFNVSSQQRESLIELTRSARYVVIRGRTDAAADTPLQTALAKRRALAAFDYLTQTARFPAEAIRVTWQGAGDVAVAGDGAAQRQANRRVEIELYAVAPQLELAAR